MSYWSQNTALSSALDDLLSKDDVTLLEVLEEPEVLQECKSQNKKLIDYLVKPDILRELIVLTTRVPAEREGETVRYKYPSIACELLTSELPVIIETIANKELLLDELYAFLESDAPLNPLLASFFSRIMGVLVAKTSEQNWFSYQVSCLQVLEYLKSKGNCIMLLLRHLGTSAIMDLILKMYTKIEGDDIRDNFLLWLDEGDFLEQLISQLTSDSWDDVVTNVCQLLCDLIMSNRENSSKSTDNHEQDRLIHKIESEKFITRLLEQMLVEPHCERSIVGGVYVLLILLGNQKRDEYPYASWDAMPISETSKARENAIAALTPFLPHILNLLHNPPIKPSVRTTVGLLEQPLGATRVELVRLMAALVTTGHEPLLMEIQRLDLLNVLLDLFFQYPWNNFLHAQVEATLVAAFKFPSIATHIFSNCRIVQRILAAWSDNDAQEKDKKPRRGYMGHVIRISNHVVSESSTPPLDTVLSDVLPAEVLVQWNEFVSTALAKVNGDQNSGTGFQHKKHNDSDSEQYYNEALAPSFADNFCDEQQLGFADDPIDVNDARTLKPGFPDVDVDQVIAKQAELFDQVCAQKLQSLDDDADLWSSIIQNPSEPQQIRAWDDGGSSDEENAANQEDEWGDGLVDGVAPVEQSNPWSSDVLSASSPPDPGWANFESSPFLANFGYELSSTLATSAPSDSEPATFDLTPTEVPMFPAEDEDWVTNTMPPSDWSVPTPSDPSTQAAPSSQIAHSSVPTDCQLVDEFKEADNDHNVQVDKLDSRENFEQEKVFNPSCNINLNNRRTSKTAEVVATASDVDGASASVPQHGAEGETLETAQIVQIDSSAEIVVASDIMGQTGLMEPSCSVSMDSATAAFTTETVIPTAASNESREVESELAQLLAEVSLQCETQSSTVQGQAQQLPQLPPPLNNLLETLIQVPSENNADIASENNADKVPKVTSKIAVNEKDILSPPAGIAPNDVTAI